MCVLQQPATPHSVQLPHVMQLLFRPGKGSSSATNVVVVVVVVVVVWVVVIRFPFQNRSSLNFADRLVTIMSAVAPCHFQVKS